MTTESFAKYQIYLGRNIGKDGAVSLWEMRGFMTDVVDPLFDSYTVTSVTGTWKGTKEDVAILEIMVPLDVFSGSLIPINIKKIASTYKSKFKQEAVLVTVTPIKGVFV